MEMIALIVVVALATLAWYQLIGSMKMKGRKLPPGPFPLPIVGNILDVSIAAPHVSFAQLSKKYGPLMSIRLGTLLNVIVTSPEMAKEIFTRPSFTSRHIVEATRSHDHHKFALGMMPVASEKWKAMRKICKEQVFGNHSLDASQHLRRQRLHQLVDYVQKRCDSGRAVNIREAAFTTMLNHMSATLFSTEDSEFDSTSSSQLKEIMEGISDVVGLPNSADFFPILSRLDPQGVRRGADLYFGRLIKIIKSYLDQRLESIKANPNRQKPNDLLETLVDISQGSDYSLDLNDNIHLLVDLLAGGTETSTITTEWVMTELLLHPEIVSKVKDELKGVVGDRKVIDEEDISRLPYLQALIKEIFRYHPAGPLLLPRSAVEDAELGGYFIPKGTQIFVNVWSIGRDPSVWPNPDAIEPERFLNKNIHYKGQSFELLPFGSGKRICPGLPLAHRIVHTTVAALVHNFDWKFAPGESVRNKEIFSGAAMRRESPLMAIPLKPRH